MKKAMALLLVCGMGLAVFAENDNAKQKQEWKKKGEEFQKNKAEALKKHAEKMMQKIKEIDPAKYEELSKIKDPKEQLKAGFACLENMKLEKIKSIDANKYNELQKLKASDPKAYAKAVNQEFRKIKQSAAKARKEKAQEKKAKK
ncbi:MAG: hypothetical protein JXR78_00945 [Victivallales bacterium]|nr:hypothetical protein [Victivallales bacterium]